MQLSIVNDLDRQLIINYTSITTLAASHYLPELSPSILFLFVISVPGVIRGSNCLQYQTYKYTEIKYLLKY